MSVVRAAVLAVAVLGAVAATAQAHEGNPNFRSEARAIAPAVAGLDVRVLNRDDSLELTNTSGRSVVVEGYRGEPYVRIAADGTVEVNRHSPSSYLNEDRYAEGIDVPSSATPDATPWWQLVDRSGRYAWHDHRIHWMARTLPPQVEDESKRTAVFDWKVPLEVGGRPAAIRGSLTWIGDQSDGGFPVGAAISLAVALLAGIAAVVTVRRRRRHRSITADAAREAR